jgi:plastocyanin
MATRPVRPLSAAWLAAGLIAGLVTASAGAAELAVFKVTARDGRFDPAVLEVPAGAAFKVEIVNENRKAIEFESRELKVEKVIAAGKTATISVKPLKAGEYRFFDEFNEATGQGKVVAK